MSNEITKVTLSELELELSQDALERTKTKLIKSHEAMVLIELRNVFEHQTTQDRVISELRDIVETLAVGQVASIQEIQSLRRNVAELAARQDIIAQICNTYAERVEQINAKAEKQLAEHELENVSETD